MFKLIMADYKKIFNKIIFSEPASKLESFFDKCQIEYLEKCTNSRNWKNKRLYARLMALQLAGEKKIITSNNFPQFLSGKYLSFAYSEDWIGLLFPVKNNMKKRFGLDIEEKFSNEEAQAIYEFFFRMNCLPEKNGKYDNARITMFWTIYEAFIKMIQDRNMLLRVLPEIFNKSTQNKKNFLHLLNEDFYWQSFFFARHWISMVFNSKIFPTIKIDIIS